MWGPHKGSCRHMCPLGAIRVPPEQINTSVQDASHIITSVQDGSTHQFRMHPFFSHCLSPTLLLARDLSHCLSQLTDTHLCYLWLLARDLLLARSGFLDPACLVLVVPQPPASGAIHHLTLSQSTDRHSSLLPLAACPRPAACPKRIPRSGLPCTCGATTTSQRGYTSGPLTSRTVPLTHHSRLFDD